MLGSARMIVAVIANMASARTISLLARVSSIAAPIGVWAASPISLGHQPAFGLIPMLLGDREDIPTAPRTSEERRPASSETGRKPLRLARMSGASGCATTS